MSDSVPSAPSPSPRAPSPPPPLIEAQYLVPDTQVLDSFYINLVCGLLCLLGWAILRGWLTGPGGVYQRRRELQDLFMRPPRIMVGTVRQLWNWVMPLLAVSDADIIRCAGFDALVLTRVLLIGLQMFTVMGILGVCILIPVYYTLPGLQTKKAAAGTLARISIANIPVDSNLFLLPFCMVYVFTGYSCWVLWINCKCYVQLRMAYFRCLDALPAEEALDRGLQEEAVRERSVYPTGSSAPGTGRQTPWRAASATAAPQGPGRLSVGPTNGEAAGSGDQTPAAPESIELQVVGGGGGNASTAVFPGPTPSASAAATAQAQRSSPAATQAAAAVLEQGTAGGNGADRTDSAAAAPGPLQAAAGPGPVAEGLLQKANNVARKMASAGPGVRLVSTAGVATRAPPPVDVASGVWLSAVCTPVGADVVPEMAQSSTWVNIANFFNPTLRMMLDYLDWMNPLQRAASMYGIRRFKLPTVSSDEAPPACRLYNSEKDPLLHYDDLMTKELRHARAHAAVKLAAIQEDDDGSPADDVMSVPPPSVPAIKVVTASGRGGSDKKGAALLTGRKSMRPTGGSDLPAVLSYWRPLRMLSVLHRGGWDVRSVDQDEWLLEGAGPSAASASGPLADPSGMSLLPPNASLATMRAAPSLFTQQQQAATAHRPTIAADPLQPLIPGKRNVRLKQLLQVPLCMPTARQDSVDGLSGRLSFPGSAGEAEADADATSHSDDTSLCLVNARHYVVLIKRVHVQDGPHWLDHMAALTYLIVNRVRQGTSRTARAAHELAVVNMRGVAHRVRDAASSLVRMSAAGVRQGTPGAVTPAEETPLGSPRPGAAAVAAVASTAPGVGLGRVDEKADLTESDHTADAVELQVEVESKLEKQVRRYYQMFYEDSVIDVLGAGSASTASRSASSAALAAAKRAMEFSKRFSRSGSSWNLLRRRRRASTGGAEGSTATDADGTNRHKASRSATAPGQSTGLDPVMESGAEHAKGGDKVRSEAQAAGGPHETRFRAPPNDRNGAAVAAVLRDLFPSTFRGLVPVSNHDPVDHLIYRWDRKMMEMAAVVRDLARQEDRAGLRTRMSTVVLDLERGPAGPEGGASDAKGAGDAKSRRRHERQLREIQNLKKRIADLEHDILELEEHIEERRAEALAKPLGTAYFALFSDSQDAQMLAQCRRVLPPKSPGCLLGFDAEPAPAPDDVNWPSLHSTMWGTQLRRRIAIVIPMAIIFFIPIGPIQGVISNLDIALCSGSTTSPSNKLFVEWFCTADTFWSRIVKSLFTGVLPSVLGLMWSAFVMPHLLFFCSSISRKTLSLSAQEGEMQTWFFWYSLINTFLGAMLAGGIFSQLGTYLTSPSALLQRIGTALPTTANFFIQFVIARALLSNCSRLIWPHAGSMMAAIFRSVLRLGRPRSLHVDAIVHMVQSARAAGFYNGILQVFMFGFAYAVVAPIILPCCWFFFLTGFFAYRYSILYVYERSYESGGRMWPVLFNQMMGFLLVFQIFTGAIFIVSTAFWYAAVLWSTLTPPLVIFWAYCDASYHEPLHHPPLSMVAKEPKNARVDPLVYMPPALRPGAIGWYPEQGKVWEKYAIPKHYC